jgi:predicted dehydrogenase
MNMWLVGAGYWGSKLLEDLKKFGITAQVIDIKNGQTIQDIDTLDPVMLATPLWEHFEQTKYLLERGHDVYVEKPLAESAPKIAELTGYVKPGQILMVGHLFVHHPQRAEIKELIRQDWIGKLQHITSRRLNWGIYQTKTDPLLSLAVHDISIVQQFAIERMTVDFAQGWNYSDNVQQDRICFGGCVGDLTYDIDVSWHWPVRTRETVFIGTHGQIVWNQDENTIKILRNTIKNRRAVVDNKPITINYGYELTPLEYELKNWIDCVKDRTQPLTSKHQALTIALVIDQVACKVAQSKT